MTAKEKFIGIIIILIGIFPFLLMISSVNTALGKYALILPGGIIYQLIIIILGVILILRKKILPY